MKMRLVFLLTLLTAFIVPAQADIAADTAPWCQADEKKPEDGKKDGKQNGQETKGTQGAGGEEAEPECD